MISRIKNGNVDEFIDNDFAFDYSYINNNWRLATQSTTWDNLALTHKTNSDNFRDINAVNGTDSVRVRTAYADLQPDEFVFNFNGFSGSFLLDHKGEWIFRGNNPSQFKIKNALIENGITIKLSDDVTIAYPRGIMGFTILTADGTEYYFGGDQTAVDFSYSLNYSAEDLTNFYSKAYKNVSSTGWHLTKIKYVSGKEINFSYSKEEFSVVGNKTRTLGYGKTERSGHTSVANTFNRISSSYSFMRNSYLKEIQTSYEIIKFSKEKLTDIVDYTFDAEDQNLFGELGLMTGIDIVKRKWFKLTKIQTFKKPIASTTQNPLIEYQLEYENSPSNRLQLKKIKQIDVDVTTNSIPQFEFNYNNSDNSGNNLALPAYLSGKIDHWGYFNANGMLDAGILSSLIDETNYKTFRMPDAAKMQYEVLKKITYPTGGFTSFEFEPHDYAVSFNNIPPTYETAFPITAEATNKMAGGLRIHKIISSDGINEIEKTYLYVKDYKYLSPSLVSSGILGSNPSYFDNFVGTLNEIKVLEHYYMNEQSVNPLNLTNGSPVTYSEVVEKNKDNSYTIYTFSNYDNPDYCNKTPKNTKMQYNSTLINPKRDPIIDYEHLRGRLLEQKAYTNLDKIVHKTKNEYTTTLATSQAIRSVSFSGANAFASWGPFAETEFRAISYYIHTSPVYLLKTTSTDSYYAPITQAASEMTVITQNEYDDRQNIKTQTVTNLNNAEAKSNVITSYRYAYHDATEVSESTETQGVKALMVTKFMIGIPLVTKNTFNKGSKVEFGAYNSTGDVVTTLVANTSYTILPFIYSSQNRTGGFTEQFRINSYDIINYDKPKQTQSKGYAAPTQTSSGINTIVNYTWENGMFKTKTIGIGNNLLTWTFTNDLNKRWITEKKDENGLKMSFDYDGYRRLTETRDRYNTSKTDDPQATTAYKYHYKGQTTDLPVDLNVNFIQTINTFKGVTTPLSTKQYLDGLGRPMEVVKENYTPATSYHGIWHQKSHIGYDALGRQEKVSLPFEKADPGFEVPASYLTSYVYTEYEKSPLSRPTRQINVDNTVVEMSYSANATDEVRSFVADNGNGNTISSNSSYAANTLYKTTVKDENGKPTCVFKDKLGRVILTRKLLGTDKVDTYNVYDNNGQLVAVLPPSSFSVNNNVATVWNTLTFQYKYDNLYRLSEKKIPGEYGTQKFYYDDRDLLTLSQDANMGDGNWRNFANQHLATQYDEIGRVVRTGFVIAADPVNFAASNFIIQKDSNSRRLTEIEYYPNKSWVKHRGAKFLEPHNPDGTNFIWSYIERRNEFNYTGNPVWTGKQHLITGPLVNRPILDADGYGVDWTVSVFNGMQQPESTYHYMYGYSWIGNQVRTRTDFEYDHGRRLTDVKFSYALNGVDVGTPATNPATSSISNLVYNHKDQVIERNIGFIPTSTTTGTALQSVDYTYNVRGWLTAINDVTIYGQTIPILTPPMSGSSYIQGMLTMPYAQQVLIEGLKTGSLAPPPIVDNNPDLFKQALTYGGVDSRTGASAQYNGNISTTTWQVAGREKQAYAFKYDDLDRLTESKYFDINDVNTGGTWNSNYSTDNKYEEKQAYDLRGNITSLQRRGLKTGVLNNQGLYTSADYGMIDNLSYTINEENKLLRVKDVPPAGSPPADAQIFLDKGFKSINNTDNQQYTYDANGNVRSDVNKGISYIWYNYLNLPSVIFMGNGREIQFYYTADGELLRKLVYDPAGVEGYWQEYINGVEYKNWSMSRFTHPEGAVVLNASGGYEYEYVMKDHLGNNRVVFSDKNNDRNIDATDIKDINNYYPFGLDMEGNWKIVSDNKYKFNGKELTSEFGLGWYNYGARFYDATIGRWNAIDPLAGRYLNMSPYTFAGNNPIVIIDPNGKELYITNGDKQALGDLIALIYNSFKRGKVTVNFQSGDNYTKVTTKSKVGADENVNLLDKISSSSKKYLYQAADSWQGKVRGGSEQTANAPRTKALNYSTTERGDLNQYLTDWLNSTNHKSAIDAGGEPVRKALIENATNNYQNYDLAPVDGFDGQVIVTSQANNSTYTKSDGTKMPLPRYYFTFHELYEVYYRTEGNGMPAQSAHNKVVAEHDEKFISPQTGKSLEGFKGKVDQN